MKKGLAIILLSFVLIGCTNGFDEYVKNGEVDLASADFDRALANYELALEEQPDNEEVQGKVDVLEKYFHLVELVDERKWEEADGSTNCVEG